jgi:hypothetical protein
VKPNTKNFSEGAERRKRKKVKKKESKKEKNYQGPRFSYRVLQA